MLHFYTLEISPTPVIYWRSSKWCLCFCFLYSILGGGLLGVRKGSPLNMVGRLLQNSTMYICMQQYWFKFNTGYFHSTTIYTGYLHSTTIFIQLQHWIFSFNDYIHSTSTRAVFVQDIENNTWAHGDMEFIIGIEQGSAANEWYEISNMNSFHHVFFCLLYNQESAIP